MDDQVRRLRAPGWRRRLADVPAPATIAAVFVVVVLVVVALASGRSEQPRVVVRVSPLPGATIMFETAVPGVTPPPADPSATITIPPSVRPVETSAPLRPPPPATPWPTADPAVWRFEGVVVDQTGVPLESVCVAIGPHGCVRGSPRTDRNGRYYIDMPQNPTIGYTITFLRPGYEAVSLHTQVSEPTVFNVVLRRT